MLGKTHMVVGTATALAVMHPDNLPELIGGTCVAVVGALISDIDVETSDSYHDANKIISLSVIAVLIIAAAELIFKVGIYQKLLQNSELLRVVIGGIIFIAVCAFGKERPHRSFMHSILAMIILSGTVNIILPVFTPYFAAAFTSHIVIDMFNYKKVRLCYPLPGGLCLNICHADGSANKIFFAVGALTAVIEFVTQFFRILL